MNRRTLLKGLLVSGALAQGFRLPLVHAADYSGKLFVFVQADGAWDPTSFCDPKANTPGEKVINHWAENDEVRQVGNLAYAPFANNQAFFEKYHRMMLVINGVDAQTNSHTVGIVHNWSGRNSEGYPTTAALLRRPLCARRCRCPTSASAASLNTAGLTRFTRLDDPRTCCTRSPLPDDMEIVLQRSDLGGNGVAPERRPWRAFLTAETDLLPGAEIANSSFYGSAFAAEGLKAYADALPARGRPAASRNRIRESFDTYASTLRRQAQLTVLAFKTGVAVSADFWLGGFDTHTFHDPDHEWLFANLTDAVDYLWDYAEEHGVADRMVVVMGSDFGRTNFYNAAEGKDHWPIGSFIIMEKNRSWTGRAVGETDGLHFAYKMDPATLRRDDTYGTIIYPKHVHKALRRYLGVENTAGALRFPFNNTEDFAFFV